MSSDFTLRANLRHTKPQVYRTVRVPGHFHLGKLHRVLQAVFGWKDYHLHEFRVGRQLYLSEVALVSEFLDEEGLSEESLRLNDLPATRKSFHYGYDFGDNWSLDIQILERTPAVAGRRPELLEGFGPNVPEDCGGIPGYEESTRGRIFDLTRGQKALARFYPVTRARPEPRPAPSEPAQPTSTGHLPLAGFRLEKLTLSQQMVGALLASPEPLTLEELADCLTAAGVDLAHGVSSLRKAWKKQPPIRERLDGRLEVDPDAPDLWRHEFHLREARFDKPVRQPPARPEPLPPEQPLTADELEATKGCVPSNFSRRRCLFLVLDTLGGNASLAELTEHLVAMRQMSPDTDLEPTLRTDALVREGDRVRFDGMPRELLDVRARFRKWAAAPVSQPFDSQAWEAKKRQERLEIHGRFVRSRRALVSWSRPERVAFFNLANGDLQVVTGLPEVAAELRELEFVFGLNPRRLGELTGVERAGRRWVDLNYLGEGARPASLPVSQLVACTLPRMVYTGEDIEPDARALAWLLAYGVQHGFVASHTDTWRAPWNIGREPSVRELIEWSVGTRTPLRAALRLERTFAPFQALAYENGVVEGHWPQGDRPTQLRSEELLVEWHGRLEELGSYASESWFDFRVPSF